MPRTRRLIPAHDLHRTLIVIFGTMVGTWCAFGATPMTTAPADDPSATKSLSQEEASFFDKHLSEYFTSKVTHLSDEALARVFSTPFYKIVVTQKLSSSYSSLATGIVARVDDHLVTIEQPGTDTILEFFPQLIAPSFKLKAQADATTLQKALDTLYPPSFDADKKVVAFTRIGTTWYFSRGNSSCRIGGKEFDCHKGFQFETDESGTITSAQYTLLLDGPLASDPKRRSMR